MIEVPAVLPVTIPEDEPIAALALLLLQVPPGVASLSKVVSRGHTVPVPVIASGNGLMVTMVVAIQEFVAV